MLTQGVHHILEPALFTKVDVRSENPYQFSLIHLAYPSAYRSLADISQPRQLVTSITDRAKLAQTWSVRSTDGHKLCRYRATLVNPFISHISPFSRCDESL